MIGIPLQRRNLGSSRRRANQAIARGVVDVPELDTAVIGPSASRQR